MRKPIEAAFAILRYDGFQSTDVPVENTVTVKQIVRCQAIAEAEVARLHTLKSRKNVRYWWHTRFGSVSRRGK
jgi:hypothetical protein